MVSLQRNMAKDTQKNEINDETAGKWRKCESYFGASTRELATWAGHELGG